MAHAAREAGYEVHVATHLSTKAAEIESHGFRVHPLDWRRGSFNPFNFARVVRQVRRLYRNLKPDLVHHVALQPSIVGSIAAIGMPFPRLNALAGLGFGFTSSTLKARFIRPILSYLLRVFLRPQYASVLVQNPDDRAAMISIGVTADKMFTIPGSGVDIRQLTPLPEPRGPIRVAFVGRLLADKGVRTLIEAHDLNYKKGEAIGLLIAGDRDPANPTSVSQAEIEFWKARPNVAVLGHVDDISKVWQLAHIAVLPSKREGLPKSLLEAAAYGRPIVATNVPGCREIARDGVNAILVPTDDPVALASALRKMASDADLRRQYGEAGRRLVEAEFSSEKIGDQIVALYDRLLQRGLPSPSPR